MGLVHDQLKDNLNVQEPGFEQTVKHFGGSRKSVLRTAATDLAVHAGQVIQFLNQ